MQGEINKIFIVEYQSSYANDLFLDLSMPLDHTTYGACVISFKPKSIYNQYTITHILNYIYTLSKV